MVVQLMSEAIRCNQTYQSMVVQLMSEAIGCNQTYQSMVVQLMSDGNWRQRDRNASPTGEKASTR